MVFQTVGMICHAKHKTLHIVTLDSKDEEYQDVLKGFEATGSSYNSIIRIQRIQNRVLYSQYVARKKFVDDSNSTGHENERMLFHGTAADTCPKINQYGFNRSFAGKNGMYHW